MTSRVNCGSMDQGDGSPSAEEPPPVEQTQAEKNKNAYPIVRHTDVPEENKNDILDTITGAIDKFNPDYDQAAKQIKENMDKTYGPYWHVIVGESFGYEVTHQNHHIMYLFYMGNLGVLVWKNN